MANSFTNTSKVAAEGVLHLVNNLAFTESITHSYTKEFKKPESIGDSITIRERFNPSVRSGATLTVQDFAESSRTLTIDTQKGVDLSFPTIEKELDVKEFGERVLKPEMANLGAFIEEDIMSKLINKVPNVVTQASLDQTVIRSARTKLNKNLAPKDNSRILLLNSDHEQDILAGTESFFHAGKAIEDQYMNGSLGKIFGFTAKSSEQIPNLVTGSRTNGAVTATAVASGATTIEIDGLGAAGTILAGEVFTIAGVYAVNHQTKQVYTELKQFCVAEDATATAGGVATVTLTEAIVSTGNTQNVSALPATDAVVTFVGSASSTYAQSVAYHPKFAAVAFCDAKAVKGVSESGSYMLDNKIGARYVSEFDITNDRYVSRWDAYYGVVGLWYPLATRIIEV